MVCLLGGIPWERGSRSRVLGVRRCRDSARLGKAEVLHSPSCLAMPTWSPLLQELQDLASKHPNLVIIPLEVTDPASIKAAAARVGEHLGGSGLNLLINNAGIVKLNSLDNETLEDMTQVYTTNTVGPLMLGQVRPLPELGCSTEAQRAGVMGSCSGGSIEEVYLWDQIHVVSYRCSKAALNMLTKCQSLGYQQHGVLCVDLHPGWVQTDLGGAASQKPPVTVEESVGGMLKVLSYLSEKETGTFLAWEAKVVPW
uniref:C-factor-like n=1 Tax=Bubo bubo TaxID=30461 RepID=A0A8C0ESE0_BUBBB